MTLADERAHGSDGDPQCDVVQSAQPSTPSRQGSRSVLHRSLLPPGLYYCPRSRLHFPRVVAQ